MHDSPHGAASRRFGRRKHEGDCERAHPLPHSIEADVAVGDTVRITHKGAKWDCAVLGMDGKGGWMVKSTPVSKARRKRMERQVRAENAMLRDAARYETEVADRNILFPGRGIGGQ